MNKSDLVAALAAKADIPIVVADKIVNEVFASMTETLVAGGRIEIRGFGSLENREYSGYSGRNPKTGEVVIVKPKLIPFFKAGKDLKERIMGIKS